jgi:hypothetical protein
VGSTIVIKDVDDEAFRNLKGEAIRSGMSVGEAATQSFRLWVQQRNLRRVRDTTRQRKAAEIMDKNRAKTRPRADWSAAEAVKTSRKTH